MKTRGMLLAGSLALLLAGPGLAVGEKVDDAVARGSMETEAEPAAMQAHVERSTFTSGVVEREPQDEVRSLSNDQDSIAFFTELKGLEGKTVIHRWEYDGQTMGEVAFDVAGPRWRVHSTKQLDPSWTGQWTVKVLDVDGHLLSEDQFEYNAAIASKAAAPAAPPAAPAE